MSVHAGPNTVETGLVLAVDAANLNSYPGTGTSISDLTLKSGNATLSSGASYSSSFGGIFQLNYSTDGVITQAGAGLPILNSITGSDPFTFSIMMRLKSYPPSGAAAVTGLLQKGSYNPSFGLNLVYAGDSGGFWTQARIRYGLRNLSGTAGVTPGYGIFDPTSSSQIALNQWYKVDFTHSFTGTSHTLRCYLNGTLDKQDTGTNSLYPINITNSSTLGINAEIIGGNFVRSDIDVAFYNIYTKELSAQEIQQNFQALRGRFGL
jgi:hypothetical protein